MLSYRIVIFGTAWVLDTYLSNKMKKLTFLLFLAAQISFGNVPFWSQTGHRTIGEIAEQNLNRRAKKRILELLDGQSIAAVANFGDDIKADKKYAKFSPWHYVNFPADKKYTDVTPSPQGDLIQGIQECERIIKDEGSSREDKVFYLKMLIHLVGDLHQPMHVGRLEDKGGNDIELKWFGKNTNLHRLWDANLIDDYQMSYTELAVDYPEITKEDKKQIQEGTIYDWVEESQDLANELYGSVTAGEKLGYAYRYKYMDVVRDQLQKGGLRLAKVLNELF